MNPSYFSPRAYADLASAHPDARWDDLAGTSRTIVTALSGSGLPPDWARVDALVPSGGQASAQAHAIPAPSGAAPAAASSSDPTSGLDAVRVALRSAESCVPADRRTAARLWPLYRRNPGAATYSLDGSPIGGQTHAASYVAAAAAAKADGDDKATGQMLDRAQDADSTRPTYYGAALVALGRVMLTSSALGACPG